jgi:hypothetical protein
MRGKGEHPGEEDVAKNNDHMPTTRFRVREIKIIILKRIIYLFIYSKFV